ncbi:kinase-like domain-containing protein [Hyaloraphidium curvatum]|nr:kinase-like domain-containing protein [Hyaloraphidium curvatum]
MADLRRWFAACQNGDVDAVRGFLESPGFDPNVRDPRGRTGLMWAARNGHADVMLALQEGGAENHQVDIEGEVPFTLACRHNHVDAVRVLVDTFGDVHGPKWAGTQAGQTGLGAICASSASFPDRGVALVRYLLSLTDAFAVDPLRVDRDGNTPFHHACRNASDPLISEFFKHPWAIDLSARNRAGQAPRELAAGSTRDLVDLRAAQHEATMATAQIDDDQLAVDFNDVLGSGGQGVVFGGSYRGRPVAVKYAVDPRRNAGDVPIHFEAMEAFRKEVIYWTFLSRQATDPANADLAGNDGRDHVLELIAFGTRPRRTVSPRADSSLDAFLAGAQGPDYLRLAVSHLRDAAAGVAFLHACSLVHADLKPANVLLFPSRAAVADFGLSRIGLGVYSCRDARHPHGSVHFAAPELWIDRAGWATPEGRRAGDVWALGVMCWCAAARMRRPFGRMAGDQIVRDYLGQGRPPDWQGGAPERELERVYRMCCRRDWRHRPTAAEVRDELAAVLAGM